MHVKLKQDPILEQDLVLIYLEDHPAFYARVEKITVDVKPKWWRVKFLMLSVPPQFITWIIDDEQIRGSDFTMDGTPVRIEKVVAPEEPDSSKSEAWARNAKDTEPVKTKPARVLALHPKEKRRKT